jgi:hypothetical protein
LGELQTIRSGIVAGLTEWKNRKCSGMVDAVAQALADVTISHFTSQLEAVDEAIAQTIDNDSGLLRKKPRSPKGRAPARGLDARIRFQHPFMPAGDTQIRSTQSKTPLTAITVSTAIEPVAGRSPAGALYRCTL